VLGLMVDITITNSNLIILRELVDTRRQLLAAQQARTREFQTLRHWENMIKLKSFLARLVVLTYFHGIVDRLATGYGFPRSFLLSLAAEIRVHLDETQKMIATADEIEALFAQKGSGAEEVRPLEAERDSLKGRVFETHYNSECGV
jgi:hypothetical protein